MKVRHNICLDLGKCPGIDKDKAAFSKVLRNAQDDGRGVEFTGNGGIVKFCG